MIPPDKTHRSLSLGLGTEMIFHRFDGVVQEHDDYIVVKTPSNPDFYFGNYVLFFEAPKAGLLAKWKKIFKQEFRDLPGVKHFTFQWDAPSEGTGDIADLTRENFKISSSIVLTTKSVNPPPRPHPDLVVRTLQGEKDWQDVTENQILSKSHEFDDASYRRFKERQMQRYRAMSERGLGYWFGAFKDGKMVGDLGIFSDGPLGRFQAVETLSEYQRQGICGTLVYLSAKFAFEKMGIQELVMVADEHYHAARIYESVGFTPSSKDYSAFWWERSGGVLKPPPRPSLFNRIYN